RNSRHHFFPIRVSISLRGDAPNPTPTGTVGEKHLAHPRMAVKGILTYKLPFPALFDQSESRPFATGTRSIDLRRPHQRATPARLLTVSHSSMRPKTSATPPCGLRRSADPTRSSVSPRLRPARAKLN